MDSVNIVGYNMESDDAPSVRKISRFERSTIEDISANHARKGGAPKKYTEAERKQKQKLIFDMLRQRSIEKKKKFFCVECKTKQMSLNSNGLCKGCNTKFGLKECQKCHELKFLDSDFNNQKSKNTCLDCKT